MELKESGLRARIGVRAACVLGPLCLPVGTLHICQASALGPGWP